MIPKDGSAKQLKLLLRKRHVATWFFYPNLMLCFRQALGDDRRVESINYERGINICKRILATAQKDPTVEVHGSMINELAKENDLTNFFKGEKKIVLGVGSWVNRKWK